MIAMEKKATTPKNDAIKKLAVDEVIMHMMMANSATNAIVEERHRTRAQEIIDAYDIKVGDIDWDYSSWLAETFKA